MYISTISMGVFSLNVLITTNPQLDIVCSWLRELLAEPRWIVELKASTVTPASLTIPEWIIRIKGIISKELSASSFTEVVLTDEGRYKSNV